MADFQDASVVSGGPFQGWEIAARGGAPLSALRLSGPRPSELARAMAEALGTQRAADGDREIYGPVYRDAKRIYRDDVAIGADISPYFLRLRTGSVSRAFFALNSGRLQALQREERARGRLSTQDIAALLAGHDENCLTPWRTDALNTFNRLFYSRSNAFSRDVAPASGFVDHPCINRALAAFLLREGSPGAPLRVHELCAGAHGERWGRFAAAVPPGRRVEVTLSDSWPSALPSTLPGAGELPGAASLSMRTQRQDLAQPLRTLAPKERFNVLLSTYGFDSVWLPEDRLYQKAGGRWFQAYFRLVVPDGHPAAAALLRAREYGEADDGFRATDLRQVLVETLFRPARLQDPAVAAILEQAAGARSWTRRALPGGLVRVVEEAFEKQLTPDGVFLIGDIGSYAGRTVWNASAFPFSTTGIAAKFHALDFTLAEAVLRSRGFQVRVRSVTEFCCDILGPESRGHFSDPDEWDTWNYLLEVRRAPP